MPEPRPADSAPQGTPPRWPPVTYWMKVAAGVLIVIALARVTLEIGSVLVLILVAFILALGFQRPVVALERRGMRRGYAVALGLVGGIVLLGAFLWLVLPDIISEVRAFIKDAPQQLQDDPFLSSLNERFGLAKRIQDLAPRVPSTVLSLLGDFAVFVFNALTVLILTIFFTVNMPKLRAALARLVHPERREDYEEIVDEATLRVGGYVIGNLIVSAIAGIVSFVAFLIIGVPFAAALAFLVALLDLIPTVGALIAAAVAVLVALLGGIGDAIATGVFFLVYQQVENYLIQPRVMRRAVSMSPALVIVAILIGGSLLGVVGALLAIPIAAVIKIMIQELYIEDRIESLER
jgi:predicted PurR-regulated permease PerM